MIINLLFFMVITNEFKIYFKKNSSVSPIATTSLLFVLICLSVKIRTQIKSQI